MFPVVGPSVVRVLRTRTQSQILVLSLIASYASYSGPTLSSYLSSLGMAFMTPLCIRMPRIRMLQYSTSLSGIERHSCILTRSSSKERYNFIQRALDRNTQVRPITYSE